MSSDPNRKAEDPTATVVRVNPRLGVSVGTSRPHARSLALTIRALTSEAEISYLLHAIAVHGRNPGPITRAQAERAVEAAERGEQVPFTEGTFTVAEISERLMAAKMLLDRGHGNPSDSEQVEAAIEKLRRSMTVQPDYTVVDDDDLAAARRARRVAIEASKRGDRVQDVLDAARLED